MDPENIIIELFKLAESDQLSKMDTNRFLGGIIEYASYRSENYDNDDYKIRLKKFKQSLSNFFLKLDSTIEEAEKTADMIIAFKRQTDKRLRSLPKFALAEDNAKIVSFIRALAADKDSYNFSEAERLIQITRQTLKKKIDKGFLEIKIEYSNKSALILKIDLIKLFRHYNATNTLGF